MCTFFLLFSCPHPLQPKPLLTGEDMCTFLTSTECQ